MQSNTRGREHEQSFNKALCEALQVVMPSLRVLPERSRVFSGEHSGMRPDILIIDPRMPPCVIECSYGKADADKDAKAKLRAVVRSGRRVVRTCIAVHIPSRFRGSQTRREDFLDGAKFGFAVHQQADKDSEPRRWPDKGFIKGNVRDLATLISSVSLPKEDIAKVAAEVATKVNESADLLEELSDAAKQKINDRISLGSVLESLKTTMVLWLNALLTQQRLQKQNASNVPPLNFTNRQLPNHVKQIKVWRQIQKENWRAIFDPAIEVLEIAGNSNPRAVGKALARLVEAVNEIEMAGLGLHINVGAELFPKLNKDRKRVAAYYTQAPTAELLAALTIRQGDLPMKEWANNTLFSKRKISDLACGTGTLLRAGYRRVQALHEASYAREGVGLEDQAILHKNAMEKGLIGTDISPIAAHLTSASLAAIGTGKPYGKTQIGWVKVGGPRNAIGSLDYFKESELTDFFDTVAGQSSGDDSYSDSTSNAYVSVPDKSIDWILMNPPYSRTRKGRSAFDIAGLSKAERKACQDKWGKTVRNEPVKRTAGLASSFLALARKKVKPGGRIGFVLPLTAAFAETWDVTRRMIEHEFTDITALAVAAKKALYKDAFSADTGMEEMLLIATRRKKSMKKHALIKCVTLYAPITRPGEAGEAARAISNASGKIKDVEEHRPVIVGDMEIGQVCVFDAGGDGAPWGPLGVLKPELANTANRLINGRLEFDGKLMKLSTDMTTLGELFRVGPTHHKIGYERDNKPTGAFEFHPIIDPTDAIGEDRAMWEADSENKDSLVVLPTHKGVPVPDKDKECKEMRSCRSNLLYARDMRWTSQMLLAATTKNKAMGGRAWTTLGHDDVRVQKAFALWVNSTLGMMVHWTQGQRTHAGRSTTQIRAIKKVPCPKLNEIGDNMLDYAAAEFNRLSSLELLPSCQAHVDRTREKIDSIVVKMLGLCDNAHIAIEELRLLWCREPTVHANTEKALELLAKRDAEQS